MDSYEFLVSVIIPVYNNAATLKRAVDSCINQSYPPSEIIIINNNSTDDTQIVINELMQKYPDLLKATNEFIPGANAARNAGLRMAKGEWIQLLDADDELLPGKLQHQTSLVKNNPDIDVLYADSIEYYLSNETQQYIVFKKNVVSLDLIDGLINSTLGRTNANLWKRSMLEKVNFFHESKTSNQEYFMMLSLYEAGAMFHRDPVVNTRIYVDGDSISRTSDAIRSVEMLKTRLEYFSSLRNILQNRNELSSKYADQLDKKIRRSYFNNYYNYNKFCAKELFEIKSNYGIEPTWIDRITTHAHQVYSRYCPKKGWRKYFVFVFYFFIKINKVFG